MQIDHQQLVQQIKLSAWNSDTVSDTAFVKQSKSQAKPLWAETSIANLVRHRSSGVYFARVRVFGKLIRQSLKTDVFSVAQIHICWTCHPAYRSDCVDARSHENLLPENLLIA